jgi:PAS domain S-box-containing protein
VEIFSKFMEMKNNIAMAVIHDITEFKFNLAKLQASEQKYRDLFERSIVAILIHQGAIIKDANQRACNLIGYAKEQPCAMTLIKLHDSLEHDDIRERTTKGDGSVNSESRWKRSAGTFVDVEMNSAFSDVQNNLKMATIRDISHRKRTESELKAARKAAEQANLAKSALSSVKEHEVIIIAMSAMPCGETGNAG